MLNKEEIININKKYNNGSFINESSLDFALSQKSRKPLYDLAYIVRALLVYHSFQDANKRTVSELIIIYFNNNVSYDKLIYYISKISINNIKDIPIIVDYLKKCIS